MISPLLFAVFVLTLLALAETYFLMRTVKLLVVLSEALREMIVFKTTNGFWESETC